MRILGPCIQNELVMADQLNGGTELVVYYRPPTPEEQISYTNNSFRRDGDEVVLTRGEARLSAACEIMTGIRDGDFGVVVDGQGKPLNLEEGAELPDDAKVAPLSSNPKSEYYREDWKDCILNQGGVDILNLLAARVFEVPVAALHHGAKGSWAKRKAEALKGKGGGGEPGEGKAPAGRKTSSGKGKKALPRG